VEQLLAGGLGTLPLAPISDVTKARVLDVIRRMKARLHRERQQHVADLWAATYTLMGLRYSEAFADLLFQEVLGMEESTTYQAIIRKGRLAGARQLLFLIGEGLFGPPNETARAAVNALENVDQLEQLGKRLPQVDSWEALLAAPPRRRRNGRRPGNA
jgi:hypothetical protein